MSVKGGRRYANFASLAREDGRTRDNAAAESAGIQQKATRNCAWLRIAEDILDGLDTSSDAHADSRFHFPFDPFTQLSRLIVQMPAEIVHLKLQVIEVRVNRFDVDFWYLNVDVRHVEQHAFVSIPERIHQKMATKSFHGTSCQLY